jgi:dTDP-4-dehydrorhamnose reductase
MKIVVTGAAGQLGSTIVEAFSQSCDVRPFRRESLDLADAATVVRTIAAEKPDTIVNCAAYNDVDGAEEHAVEALRVNALAVRALARAAAETGATLVHYGTDFVFDGNASVPYSEDVEPSPQSVYASSKLLGEWFAADAPRYYVLRVESLFGGGKRRSSVDRIVSAIRAGEPARVFTDRTVTPSYVRDVAAATMQLLTRDVASGVYHCVNSGVTTWFELAQEIGRILGIEPSLVPVKVADVQLKAKRPQYAALSNAKLAHAGVVMPDWRDALRRYLTRQNL